MVPLDHSGLASFLMSCLVAPSRLGVPVVDAEKAHRLGQPAKVRRQLPASLSSTCILLPLRLRHYMLEGLEKRIRAAGHVPESFGSRLRCEAKLTVAILLCRIFCSRQQPASLSS